MFSVILAVDNKGGIGKNNELPWYNKEDLRHFKKKTIRQVIIMGRRTWESLPVRPLPNRVNVVLSTTTKELDGALVCTSLANCIRTIEPDHKDKEWFIIGGGKVLKQVLKMRPIIKNIYLTKVDSDYKCDVQVDLSIIQHRKGVSFPKIDEKLNQYEPYTWSYREYYF